MFPLLQGLKSEEGYRERQILLNPIWRKCVAERNFRMTCPIQPESYFQAAPKIEENPRNSVSLRNPQWERTSYRLLLNSSSSIIHYEENHLVYGPLVSILLDQGILVKNKLDDTL